MAPHNGDSDMKGEGMQRAWHTEGGPPPVVMTQPGVVMANPMGPKPSPTTCQSCNQQIVTRVETKASTKTHLIALCLCCCICWPCAWIPYCMASCQNADHYCPNCNAYIGGYKN